ncbi:hypothetical protein OHB41_45915 [Streptomyces sp. NBC_01571]|uniref:hypothetical protein n=1 Tax=Streptomyces sp. NBC_01571 TaxID=2975883 RepID=UPI00225BAC1D|nr:hypothetical protein [Streptomyces sp. NBC_01571]MCX4580372.1 hypothetical protein [Streptomyces sp. NBC_01571]
MTEEWYVLIEEDARETERVDGGELQLHRWTLVGTHYIDGGEEQATAAAEDAALHFMPRGLALHARPGDEPARHAFLTQFGAWVVLIRQRTRECHIRVTTAQLVHFREEREAPPKTLKQKLLGAVQAPPPSPKPWTPPTKA